MKWFKKITIILLISLILAVAYFADKSPSVETEKAFKEISVEKTAEIPAKIENDIITEPDEADEAVNPVSDENQEQELPDSLFQEVEEEKNTDLVCTLSVRCDTINENAELFDEAKRKIIPPDGIIFEERNVTFYEGDSVFDVLLREMKENGIHFEYVSTPIYDGVYIEGIGNIYEFDFGSRSGWLYCVNDEFPGYSCSQHKIKNGDVIKLLYTCDMGKDVGK